MPLTAKDRPALIKKKFPFFVNNPTIWNFQIVAAILTHLLMPAPLNPLRVGYPAGTLSKMLFL
jgi:hypothetical protein